MTQSAPLSQMIVHWQHVDGGEAHCLARIYQCSSNAVVILSEIRSNDRAVALMLDLAGAANALIETLSNLKINPETAVWMIQHGAFSDYEALDLEEWAEAGIFWTGQRFDT